MINLFHGSYTYVIDCRRGGVLQNQYDMVEGGVANDNVIDTVEDYENGVITAVYKNEGNAIMDHFSNIMK